MSRPPPLDAAARIQELEAHNRRLQVLLETGRALASEISLDRLLGTVLQQVSVAVQAERSSLFLLDREHGELYSKIAQGIDDLEIRFPVGRGLAGHVATSGQRLLIADVYQDSRFNPEVDRGTGFRTSSMLVVPLKNSRGEVLGVIQALNHSSGQPFSEAEADLLEALAGQAGISIENARLYERIERLFDAFVQTIVSAIDARDPTTSGHSHRVSAYSLNLARSLHRSDAEDFRRIEFTRDGLRTLRYAGLLHDVGKIGVRESVLCKRYSLLLPELKLVDERIRRARAEAELEALRGGRAADPARLEEFDRLAAAVGRRQFPGPLDPDDAARLRRAREAGLLSERQYTCLTLERGNLNDDEWLDMASHVSQSYELLVQIPWPEDLARIPEIAWSHHEKLDGTGYPRRAKASEFPFEGQIVAVADIFDALTASDRPYKRSYSRSEAKVILEEEVERDRMDGRLVRAFFEYGCDELPPETPRPAAAPPPDPEI